MHFGFALDLSDIDLLNVDLLDQRNTRLDFFVSKICLQDVFKTCLQDVFKTCLQRNNFSSSKTSWKTKNCYAEDMLKTSSRHFLKTS